jgi:hypothetical protein
VPESAPERSSLAHDLGLHYAGLPRPRDLGAFGVDENAARLRRYEIVLRKLVYLQAGHLPRRAIWELKVALGKHLYEDAEAVASLRTRILDLRQNANVFEREPDQRLMLMLEELLHARTDEELLVGIYEVLKPALLHTLREHMRSTQQLVDHPTIRVLRTIVADLEDQLAWGQKAIRLLVDGRGRRAAVREFADRIRGYLTAAGGIGGREDGAASVAGRRWRSLAPFTLPEKSVRDERVPSTVFYRHSAPDHIPSGDEVRKRLIDKMRVRQEEMTAAELIAGVIWLKQDQSWDFTLDLARHCWDEVRHALFGQAALEAEGIDWLAYPQYTSDYDVNITNLPAAQYAWLSVGIEGGAMKRTGKRAEFEFCRDEARHPLMTQFQDYDWADEVNHAGFGREWASQLYDGDMEQARTVAAQALDEFWSAVRQATAEHDGQDVGPAPETSKLGG